MVSVTVVDCVRSTVLVYNAGIFGSHCHRPRILNITHIIDNFSRNPDGDVGRRHQLGVCHCVCHEIGDRRGLSSCNARRVHIRFGLSCSERLLHGFGLEPANRSVCLFIESSSNQLTLSMT